jgi:hypothetical protein
MIPIEFTVIDEEVADFEPTRLAQYWSRASDWAREGRRSAEALLQYGHKGLRVVVDSEWELAITCDDCNLWASMTRKLKMMKMSHQSVGGTLLKVVECSPTAVRDHFRGQVTPADAWSGYSGWRIDTPIISSRDGEYLYPSVAGRQHSSKKKKMEAIDEATTEE